jgi:hypothetical protein
MKCCINERATTKSGLKSQAYILEKEFERGLKEPRPLPEGYPLERKASRNGTINAIHPTTTKTLINSCAVPKRFCYTRISLIGLTVFPPILMGRLFGE